MNTISTPETIFEQIARIQRMEKGTLSIIRETPDGPCCNFQRWEGILLRSSESRAASLWDGWDGSAKHGQGIDTFK